VFLGGAFASPTQSQLQWVRVCRRPQVHKGQLQRAGQTGSELNYYFLLGQQQPV